MDFQYKERYQYFCGACLNLTDACNCACKYCFVAQKPHYMTYEVAKEAVDFLVNNLKEARKFSKDKNRKIHLTYFGGEPTLMWDEIIVPITRYIKENYSDLFNLGITTNGTLLNAERIQYLKENKIGILLSCDGAPKTQDFNRPLKNGGNSSELIKPVIPMLLEAFPNITIRGTIYQPTCSNFFENYLYAEQKGFKNAFFCPNCRETWTKENVELLQKEIDKLTAYTILSFESNRIPLAFIPLERTYKQVLIHDLDVTYGQKLKLDKSRSIIRCGLGSGAASIAYDGKIYGCQEQDSRGTDSYFYMGDIYSGVDVERHKKILSDYAQEVVLKCENDSRCESCPLRSGCYKENCPSVAQDLFHNFFIRPEMDCIWHTMLFDSASTIMNYLVKQDNKLFKSCLERYLK